MDEKKHWTAKDKFSYIKQKEILLHSQIEKLKNGDLAISTMKSTRSGVSILL